MIGGRIPDGRRVEAAGDPGIHAGHRVLHHQAVGGSQAQVLRRQQEHLRVGLGVGNVVPIGDLVKIIPQPDPI